MELDKKILSDIVTFMKYSKYLPEQNRRETWTELVDRNRNMHISKFPQLEDEINSAYKLVYDKKVLPSMRSLQFAGKSIEITPNRIFNCAYLPIDNIAAFSETMFLLLSGCGVGFSVQTHHVEQLPEIRKPPIDKTKRWLISDSIEGWADAVKILIKSYFKGGSTIKFDFRDIRPKGSRLITSGGKAPGAQPLKECLLKVEGILSQKNDGEQLKPIEAHDIICHIADAVLAGGIRRAALISLFNATDDNMLASKSGNWWETNPQRGRANNSAVILRHKITKDFFSTLWKKIEASNAGEPGLFFTNDKDLGTNPCAEVALIQNCFCNLTEINASNIISQEDFNERARVAAFIGTLQASYTDFHYLRPIWKKNTEKDALIGVGMTGIASNSIFKFNIIEASKVVKEENERAAKLIGINKAVRCCTVKPSGTSSLTLGTSSGIHAWFNDFFIRRIRVGKNESIYSYLASNHPELIEDEYFRPHDTAVISVPQKAPENASLRFESPIQLLERVKKIQTDWIRPSHRRGSNYHNVSVTVSIKDHEWYAVGEWLWENKDYYNGISVLPYDGGSYKQTPFEDITEEKYNEMVRLIHDIDLSKVIELEDNTNLQGEVACSADGCEIK